MSVIWVQATGLVLLLLGIGLGERGLQRRLALTGAMRQARVLAILTGFGGLIGATAWGQNLPYAFAWALPLVAARFLAVAAVAFGVVALRAAWIGTAGQLRMVALMLLAYLAPLAGVILVLHLDRFDPLSPVTYAFFAIVVGMVVMALLAVLRLPYDERGLSAGLLGWIGTLAGVWGLALFIWPAGPAPLLWPWPDDPLTTRLIAAMFLTVATACHYAEGRAERLTAYILCIIYGTGISIVVALALVAGKPGFWAYLVFWAGVVVIALREIFRERAVSPAHAPSHRD